MKVDSPERAISIFNNFVWNIRYKIMESMFDMCENSNITGFDFGDDYGKHINSTQETYNIMTVKFAIVQISVLNDLNEKIEEIISEYIDTKYFCCEFWNDERGIYIEIMFDDFE